MTENGSTSTPGRNRLWVGLLIGLAALATLALIAVVAVVALDPFNLHLWDRLTGRYDAAMTAMPPDTVIYSGLNLANATGERFDRLAAPWLEQAESAEPVEDFLDQLDEGMMEELGVSYRQDIEPWLGQYLGFGFREFELDEFGFPESIEWILAAETRDRRASDDFLDKLGERWSRRAGRVSQQEEYRGVALVTWASDEPMETLSYGRSGSMVIFASGPEAAKQAVDALKGESMADLESYRMLLPELPRERAMTFVAAPDYLERFYDQLGGVYSQMGIGPTTFQLDYLSGLAATLSLVDAGLQMEAFVAYDLERLPEMQRQIVMQSGTESRLLGQFPADTLLFFGSRDLSLTWQAFEEGMAAQAAAADFEESMDLFVQQFGIDPSQDLFPYLTGEWGFGLLSKQGPVDPSMGELPLTVAFLSETSDEAAIEQFLGQASGLLETMLFMSSDRSSRNGRTFYEVVDPFGEGVAAAYGVGSGYLYIGSSSQVIEQVLDAGPSLAESERYRAALEAFPPEMIPVLYLDLEGLLDAFSGPTLGASTAEFDEALRFMRPIKRIVAAGAPIEHGLVHSTMIVFIGPD